MVSPIEPKIKPLVDALNNNGICYTFSSCQGHYEDEEQEFMDRNHADVRFDLCDNISLEAVEHFLTFLITEFQNRHSCTPISLTAHKLYAPTEDYSLDFVYVIELTPFDRFESSKTKREITDIAILQTTQIVNDYKKLS